MLFILVIDTQNKNVNMNAAKDALIQTANDLQKEINDGNEDQNLVEEIVIGGDVVGEWQCFPETGEDEQEQSANSQTATHQCGLCKDDAHWYVPADKTNSRQIEYFCDLHMIFNGEYPIDFFMPLDPDNKTAEAFKYLGNFARELKNNKL